MEAAGRSVTQLMASASLLHSILVARLPAEIALVEVNKLAQEGISDISHS